MFDYGKEGNLKKYGQEKAPQYNLGNINFNNIHLFVGKYDKLATIQDVKKLYKDLINAKNKVIIIVELRLIWSWILGMLLLFGERMLLLLTNLLISFSKRLKFRDQINQKL